MGRLPKELADRIRLARAQAAMERLRIQLADQSESVRSLRFSLQTAQQTYDEATAELLVYRDELERQREAT